MPNAIFINNLKTKFFKRPLKDANYPKTEMGQTGILADKIKIKVTLTSKRNRLQLT